MHKNISLHQVRQVVTEVRAVNLQLHHCACTVDENIVQRRRQVIENGSLGTDGRGQSGANAIHRKRHASTQSNTMREGERYSLRRRPRCV